MHKINEYSGIKEIREYLDFYGVPYKKTSRKVQLVKLMENLRDQLKNNPESRYKGELLSPEDLFKIQRLDRIIAALKKADGVYLDYLSQARLENLKAKEPLFGDFEDTGSYNLEDLTHQEQELVTFPETEEDTIPETVPGGGDSVTEPVKVLTEKDAEEESLPESESDGEVSETVTAGNPVFDWFRKVIKNPVGILIACGLLALLLIVFLVFVR